MHSRVTVSRALALQTQGFGARRIARRLNVPVATVRDWLAGSVPKHSRGATELSPVEADCALCGQAAHAFGELPADYVYLLGLYLGDGSLTSCARGVYLLRITLDVAYPGIIAAATEAVRTVKGGHVVARPRANERCVDVASYWKAWPCLLPQHGPGRKQDREITLAEWQVPLVERWPEQLLRGLIHSDGHRFINTGRGNWTCPRYGFHQVSDDIRAIFCRACDQLGLRWTRSGSHTIYVSRKADVARLDRFIGPKS